MGHLGQQDRIVVATMKGGETLPGKKGENRGRTERNVDTRKGGSLAMIVCRKAVVETAQGESRKERREKVSVGGRHRVTLKEEERGGSCRTREVRSS